MDFWIQDQVIMNVFFVQNTITEKTHYQAKNVLF